MEKNRTYEDTIDLIALFMALLKKWWLIAIAGILCAGISLAYTVVLVDPLYKSGAMLYILNKTTTVTSLADIQIGRELTADFSVIATSKPVIDGAIEKIKEEHNREFSRSEINSMLSISNRSDTRILQISAISTDPEVACWVANAVAEETASKMSEIMKADPPTTVEEAEVSTVPISPSVAKNTVMGFLMGAVIVCGILVIKFLMNDNIKTEEDIEKYLGLTNLVVIPYMKEREND